MGLLTTCAPYVAMVVVQLFYGGSAILVKVSLEQGMSQLVFVVYRHLIAMFVLGPLAYAFERKQHPSLSFRTLVKIFVLSSLGTTIHLNIYYMGLNLTSPTVATALSNVIPGLTFLLAIIFRMEKVAIRSVKGQAKVFGTLICIAGALLFTFWKGGHLFESFVRNPLFEINHTENNVRHRGTDNWIKGSALILISYVAWSAWLILQASVCEVYPARLSLNTMICFFASLQSSVVALIFDRKPDSWKVEWNVQLLTLTYCGVVNSAFLYYLQTWCISKKGPVFTAMFAPLLLIIVAIFSAFIFAERLHLGSLFSAFLIIIGLYSVLWGKNKDIYLQDKSTSQKSSRDDHQTVLDISITDKPATVPTTKENTSPCLG